MEHVAQASRDDGYVSQEQGGNLVQVQPKRLPSQTPRLCRGLDEPGRLKGGRMA